jgi:hypothetical protein
VAHDTLIWQEVHMIASVAQSGQLRDIKVISLQTVSECPDNDLSQAYKYAAELSHYFPKARRCFTMFTALINPF